MKVVFFYRHRLPGNFSIEGLFEQIRSVLPCNIAVQVKELSLSSNGFFKRLYISVEALFHQGDINHITGDIHFIALFLKGKHTVLTIHDLGFMNHPNRVFRFILKWFWVIIPVKRCAAVTVVSHATKGELFKYVGSYYQDKIHVIYNPVKSIFIPVPKVFNQKEPVILQIGTKHNKNLSRLIKALEGINCRLEIVGRLLPDVIDELKQRCISYSHSDNLTIDELFDKYRKADIISFVSTLEGFGMPIVEANAMGRVVVTSKISSMPEIAGNAAHLVDPLDVTSIREGFLKVMIDERYREQLILNGYENRKRFDLDEITKKYIAVYESLASENSRLTK